MTWKVAHLDADAFYATVHETLDPSLCGRPLIVAGRGPRSVVTTASYEARRRYGVRSGMSVARAAMLADAAAVFLPPDFPSYRQVSQQAFVLMGEVAAVVQPVSLDEAYLSLDGLEDPVRAMRDLIGALREVTKVQYSCGIGESRLCAKVLSDLDKPAAFNAMTRQQCCDVFAGRPVRLLPGVGPKTAQRLERLDISTVGDLQRVSRDVLVGRFGVRHGHELHRRAWFFDDSPVAPRPPAKSQSKEDTFAEDVTDTDVIADRAADLAEELCERLRGRGRNVAIKVKLDDFSVHTRAKMLDEFTDDPQVISAVARELVAEFGVPRPLRLIGVRVSAFEDEVQTPDDDDDQQLQLPFS